jgi:hypothetical protein
VWIVKWPKQHEEAFPQFSPIIIDVKSQK